MGIKKFREIRTDDYVSKTCKYKAPIILKNGEIKPNYNTEIRKKIDNVIYSIFEDNDMCEYYKVITSLNLFTTKLQNLIIHQGSGGNGKGILSTILRFCLGDYFLVAENTFLTSSFKAGSPNPTLADSKSVRYLYVSEPDDGKDSRFNVDFIKSTTGGDPITTRALYGKNITFIPQFSVQVQCNAKPKLGKIDKGIVRRIKIIPYLLNFVDNPKAPTDRRRDYNLVDEINKEEFRNEFILMLIEKAVYYFDKDYAKDIKIPDRVSEETNEYFDDNNPIKEWIEANIIITNNENDKIKTTDVHKMYNDDDDVDTHLNAKDMMTYMKFNGFVTKKSNGTNWYTKCKLIKKPNKLNITIYD